MLFCGLSFCSSFPNPFKDFTQTWFSSLDNIVNHISTSFVADDHMFMASLDLEPISTLSQGIYIYI